MSLSESILNYINDAVEKYIDRVVDKYNLNKDELYNLWTSGSDKAVKNVKSNTTKVSALTSIDTDDISEERLIKCTKVELSALCKARSLKCTGTKSVLISRLLGNDENAAVVKKVSKSTKGSKAATSSSSVINKLTANVPNVAIRRNRFDNYEHPETHFVFDKKTQRVLGKQDDDGTVLPLSVEDINMCKKYKFNYMVPDNLNQGASVEVKIDELDDEEDDVSEEEIEEEIEEDDDTILEDEEDEDEDDEIIDSEEV